MYENAVPVFEMKNKLSFYLHKAKEEGPVFISNHGKTAFVLQTIEEYEEQNEKRKEEKNIFEVAADLRKKYGLTDEVSLDDITDYFNSLRDHNYYGPEESEHLFDEV